MIESKYTKEFLEELRALPLYRKVQLTQNRIIEWYQHFNGDVCISFSGGKDSTVLLHIARQIFPNIKAVFSNTGLEYPEIQAFVMKQDNVDIIRPKMQFPEVISTYGYPLISKEVAEAIYYARRIVPRADAEEEYREREQAVSETLPHGGLPRPDQRMAERERTVSADGSGSQCEGSRMERSGDGNLSSSEWIRTDTRRDSLQPVRRENSGDSSFAGDTRISQQKHTESTTREPLKNRLEMLGTRPMGRLKKKNCRSSNNGVPQTEAMRSPRLYGNNGNSWDRERESQTEPG